MSVKEKNKNLKTNFKAAFLYLLYAERDWNIQHMSGDFS